MKIYLGGAINGCTDEECKDWREFIKTLLLNHTLIDPMARDYRGRELDPGIAAEIVELDKTDIDSCHIMLINYVKPSVGTSMEVLYGWENSKYIIVVAKEGEVLSPWLIYHSDAVVHSFGEAVKLIELYNEPRFANKGGPF